jgi:Cys-tRNA(Pro) deacylase
MDDAVARVEAALRELGIASTPMVFDRPTSTAEEAAVAVGCELGQIVKTLVFVADGRYVLVLAAGDRRVDPASLARLLGMPRKRLRMATPAEVLAATGFEVGGVPPVGHRQRFDVIVDESLARFATVWAAAGAPNAVFAVEPGELVRAARGQWAAIAQER